MISRAWNAIKSGDDVETLKRRVSELEMAFVEEVSFSSEIEEKLKDAQELAEYRRIELIKVRGTLHKIRVDRDKLREKMLSLYSASKR